MTEEHEQTLIDFRDYKAYLEGIKEECAKAHQLSVFKSTLRKDDLDVILKALKRAKDIRV